MELAHVYMSNWRLPVGKAFSCGRATVSVDPFSHVHLSRLEV